ncbi:MAG TPA: GNAT family N-acetyltransferase [Clostridiales bacterium]|nr:GNAT family N-acetyltransferase [Clostridiales bacterium]
MNNFDFTALTQGNARSFKSFLSEFAEYCVDSLKHLGEAPFGRRYFKNKFIEELGEPSGDKERYIIMHSGNTFIGYTYYILSETEGLSKLEHGAVIDFFISPRFRGKGYGRILNSYVEKAIADYGSRLIMLNADPVTGHDFWRRMGYKDTGLNKARGIPLVCYKQFPGFDSAESFACEIEEQKSDTGMYPVNPYNKRLIKTLEPLWISYWQNALKNSGKTAESKRKIKKRLRNRTEFARKTPKYLFAAFYHCGTVKGFAQYGVSEGFSKLGISDDFGYIYEFGVSESFRREGCGTAMNKHIEEFFVKHGATVSVLTPDAVTGLDFWKAMGYEDTGVECENGNSYYIKRLS